MIVNRYLNIKLSLMLLLSTSVNNLLIHSAECCRGCKSCKGKNNDGNGKAIKQKKLVITIAGVGKNITDIALDGKTIEKINVNLNEAKGIVNHNFNTCVSVVKIEKGIFESITTDFNNLNVTFTDKAINKYLCAVVKNKDRSCYIVFSTESMIEAGGHFYGLFQSSTNSSIHIIRNEGLVSLYSLFLGCGNLTKLDLSYLDTHAVTTMKWMFSECKELTTLNLSSFDTQNVTDMNDMFSECSGLTKLNLSNFNTEKVTSMDCMFYKCSSLKELNLINFNTQNVTNMRGMFQGCSSLKELNLSRFNTTNVTYMYNMFFGCSSLINLDLSNFNTEKVTDMHDMFKGCSSLKELNLSNFNTQNVINMSCMFTACRKLSTISLPGIQHDTCNYSSMLKSCTILQNLQIIYQADKTPSKGLIEYLILNNYENTGLPMEKNGTISISYTKKNQAD